MVKKGEEDRATHEHSVSQEASRMLCSAVVWRAEIGFRQIISFALAVCTVLNSPKA